MKTNILQKQPDRTTSVAAVSTMTGRQGSISPERLRVERYLEAARRPHTNKEISEATGINITSIRSFTQKLMHDGRVRNMADTGFPALYIMADKVPKTERSGTGGRFVPTGTYTGAMASPARQGAADHEDIPSRRSDGLVKHMPMILMASKVTCGVSST